MAIGLVKDSSVARDGADQGLGGIVDGRWCGECAARPSEGIPNGGTHVLAVCAAPGQLDYFATLALQQHGQQSALRKGRRHNFLFSLSKRWTIFAGIPFIPSGRFASGRTSALIFGQNDHSQTSRDPTNRRIASQSAK
jgi:hypothetical protein